MTTKPKMPTLPEWSKRDDLGGLAPSEIRAFITERDQQWAERVAEQWFNAITEPQPVASEPSSEKLGDTCADGGKCHHGCTSKCFRRECCEPFSDYSGPWKYGAEPSSDERADLLSRCEEILHWHKTGVLTGDVLREYAARKYGDNHDALQCAENDTAREAYAALLSSDAKPASDPTPVDMVLYCPKCGTQHIDAPETPKNDPFPYTEENGIRKAVRHPPRVTPPWTNPPHKSHLCHGCGHIWRPSDTPTNGVARTASGKDAGTSPASEPVAVPRGWREAVQGLVDDIDGLIEESQGVYGLHLNGDPSPWDELVEGGYFERLAHLDQVRSMLSAAPTTQPNAS